MMDIHLEKIDTNDSSLYIIPKSKYNSDNRIPYFVSNPTVSEELKKEYELEVKKKFYSYTGTPYEILNSKELKTFFDKQAESKFIIDLNKKWIKNHQYLFI